MPSLNTKKFKPELRAQVIDDEILVSLPGSYSVTYYKAGASPQLLARQIPDKDDPRIAMKVSEFLIEAWRVASAKARTLGWIA
ncbi:hypothetical protein AUC71_02905 [Methyloceanibacter marginalis]|uniref:Uncharacterized protein n=1 Tax=Methyloceanibacter marginalis TaxID=1774971 RepID=A0A1E3W808_9HYPH|nr:hypothetical protein AUC71_02905 [Methyloceanibacter marginalis]